MQSITLLCIILVVINYTESARKVKFTYYWIAYEDGWYMKSIFNMKNVLFFTLDFPVSADHILKNCHGGTLAIVSKAFWNSLQTDCSGRLRTGESVKYFEFFFSILIQSIYRFISGGDSSCNCFAKVPGPLGPKGNRLRPYTSIGKCVYSFQSI